MSPFTPVTGHDTIVVMTSSSNTVEIDAPTAQGGWASAAGHRRPTNQDAVLCGPGWFVVADGMGGHRAGEVAATIAVDVMAGHASGVRHPDDAVEAIRAAVAEANDRVLSAATGPRRGMGTTLVGVTPLTGGGAAVFHLGDSRCYRLHDGVLSQVTSDHTHVRDLVDLGRLDPQQAGRHPLRNVVTRHLGGDVPVVADVVEIAAPVGRLLLCSDGLSDQLTPRQIGRVLAGVADPTDAARRLVELVLGGTAPDNVTALVVDLDPTDRTVGPPRPREIGETVGWGGGAS